jgi:hypothetical protein
MPEVVWVSFSYFCSFYANETLPYNIVIVASAEEENSGKTD